MKTFKLRQSQAEKMVKTIECVDEFDIYCEEMISTFKLNKNTNRVFISKLNADCDDKVVFFDVSLDKYEELEDDCEGNSELREALIDLIEGVEPDIYSVITHQHIVDTDLIDIVDDMIECEEYGFEDMNEDEKDDCINLTAEAYNLSLNNEQVKKVKGLLEAKINDLL